MICPNRTPEPFSAQKKKKISIVKEEEEEDDKQRANNCRWSRFHFISFLANLPDAESLLQSQDAFPLFAHNHTQTHIRTLIADIALVVPIVITDPHRAIPQLSVRNKILYPVFFFFRVMCFYSRHAVLLMQADLLTAMIPSSGRDPSD